MGNKHTGRGPLFIKDERTTKETLRLLIVTFSALLLLVLVVIFGAREQFPSPEQQGGVIRTVPTGVPARLRISQMVTAQVEAMGENRFLFNYKIERKKGVSDSAPLNMRYPALKDWNLKPPGASGYATVAENTNFLYGEARCRIGFVGDIKLEATAEIVKGSASLMINVDRSGQGYEFRLNKNGKARIIKRSTKEKSNKLGPGLILGEAMSEFVEIAPKKDNETYALSFMQTGNVLSAHVDGKKIITVELPENKVSIEMDTRERGNVSLRSPLGACLWSEIKITGSPEIGGIQKRYETASILVTHDDFEPNESWLTARDIAGDGESLALSFSKDFDEDWFAISALERSRLVINTSGHTLGISPLLTLIASDGKSALIAKELIEDDDSIQMTFEIKKNMRVVYLKIAEKDGRRGNYNFSVELSK